MYRITFLKKKGGRKHYVIDIEARTAKLAKEKVKELWEKERSCHMFDVKVRRLGDSEKALYHGFCPNSEYTKQEEKRR